MVDLRDCDTKCPYCGHYLHCGQQLDMNGEIHNICYCSNDKCTETEHLLASESMWKHLDSVLYSRDIESHAHWAMHNTAASLTKQRDILEKALQWYANQPHNIIAKDALETVKRIRYDYKKM